MNLEYSSCGLGWEGYLDHRAKELEIVEHVAGERRLLLVLKLDERLALVLRKNDLLDIPEVAEYIIDHLDRDRVVIEPADEDHRGNRVWRLYN